MSAYIGREQLSLGSHPCAQDSVTQPSDQVDSRETDHLSITETKKNPQRQLTGAHGLSWRSLDSQLREPTMDLTRPSACG